MQNLPWYVWVIIELVKLLPAVINAIKSDPKENKEAARVVVKDLKDTLSR